MFHIEDKNICKIWIFIGRSKISHRANVKNVNVRANVSELGKKFKSFS